MDVVVPRLAVGYVMGIGDQVPSGIAQLGHAVTLLDAQALATADLSRFDAIVTGTRAYAVRSDLRTYNRRLLDYVKAGGNMIVLYNTAELDPARFAPYPGELTSAPRRYPRRIRPSTFSRPGIRCSRGRTRSRRRTSTAGSSNGDRSSGRPGRRYTPMIETWDQGQVPQRGGWLTTRYGQGRYTYFAYAHAPAAA